MYVSLVVSHTSTTPVNLKAGALLTFLLDTRSLLVQELLNLSPYFSLDVRSLLDLLNLSTVRLHSYGLVPELPPSQHRLSP